MTATSLGTALSGDGGGGPRCTLLASFKKRKIKTTKNRRLTGNCAAGAVDARNQEEAGNSERLAGSLQEPGVVVVAALAPPLPLKVQEPVNKERGHHDFNGEVIWASKKQRSSNAAARESGNAIAEAAAAAMSSPIVQELAGNRDGGNPICKKGHLLPWGCVGVAMDEKIEKKLQPSVFATPVDGFHGLRQDWEVTVVDIALPSQGVQKPVERDHHYSGEEACWLIKRSCLATVAVCEGTNGDVGQSRAIPSAPSTVTQEPVTRKFPTQEAKGAGQLRLKNNHSGRRTPIRKTPMRPSMSLSSGLQCLGVSDVTPVLAKTLTATDSCLHQSRLQFSPRDVMESPLMSILTPEECKSVHKMDGLELEAIDRHGYSYNMRFKYVYSARQYRLMQDWVLFLTQNGVHKGDMVEVGAFRVGGRPMLTLLNYATEGWIPEETHAADGLLRLSELKDGTRSEKS
ncbi:unnamed protein product [Urochloa decumbens]|uniref:TF-B3 domain-containing protein n=1 Tax=Urochloa decumbens TaxID=240449 RepID=A0ABC9GNL5_9POAL